MTCIVGWQENGKVWVGGDSCGANVDTYVYHNYEDAKVFQKKDIDGRCVLFGFSDSFRMGQLLKHKFIIPTQESDLPDDAYMSTAFVDAIRECFAKGGFSERENGVESGGDFIVGYKKRLYVIYRDFQVRIVKEKFCAIGSGEEAALGSLFTFQTDSCEEDVAPEGMVLNALEAASKVNAYVRPPFFIISSHCTKKKGEERRYEE